MIPEEEIKVRAMAPYHAGLRLALDALDEERQKNEKLLLLTQLLDEHPEDYDGPCLCRTCMSYVDRW